MKKRINSKDLEVGRKALLAFRKAVPEGATNRQAIIGAEMLIAECFAWALGDDRLDDADEGLRCLMEEHDDHVEMMTRMFMVFYGRRETGGEKKGENELNVEQSKNI